MSNFNDKLQTLLKTDSRFLDQEWDLIRNEIINKAFKIDEKLIELLISDDEIKSKFFNEIKGHRVFNINTFVDFIQDKNFLDDSYTKYKNKIWLNIWGKFLRERDEVSLVRPYKDCILEWGQSKEDQKRKEIFFNEILAQDEIDRLLDPKVLTNFKKYTKDWEKKVEGFTRDENGTIKDNLIIKGNNLLALHSLKKEFAGKVKLIYIDPPYNTGNDGFNYNDNFNHSTWLTFMKNRLEVARELLSKEWSIYIQLDYNEVHYCKILMDEVFGKDNFQREIIRDISVLSWYKTIANNWIRWHDSILFYSKDKENLFFNKLKTEHSQKYLERFNKIEEWTNRKYFDWRWTKLYLDEVIKKWKSIWDVRNDIISFQQNATSKERVSDFAWQKPEKLLERIILSATNEWDIVLDYHIWTGTTSATAHKLWRQYIGIEQLNYGENDSVIRLQNVINGDQSWISKSVNRQWWWEFIYCELKKYNQDFMDQIQDAKKTEELLKIWENMKTKSFLNYNVDIAKQDEAIEGFKQLSLEQQKQALVELLDKNQLYVNLSEINDEDFEVSKEDKKLNDLFYNP